MGSRSRERTRACRIADYSRKRDALTETGALNCLNTRVRRGFGGIGYEKGSRGRTVILKAVNGNVIRELDRGFSEWGGLIYFDDELDGAVGMRLIG